MRIVTPFLLPLVASCAATAPRARGLDAELAPVAAPRAGDAAPLADATDAEELTLREVVALALVASPELAAMREEREAAAGRAVQAGLWPNPTLALEARDVPKSPMAIGRGGRWAMLTQPLALGGRIGDAHEAALRDEEAAAFDAAAAELGTIAQARRLGAELAAARAALALRRETERGAVELLEGARRRAASGTAAAAEVGLMEIEAERAGVETRRGERELAAAASALRAFLGGRAPRLASVRWSDEDDAERPLASVREDAFQVRAATLRAEAAAARHAEAKSMRVPDIEVSLAYGVMGEEDEELAEAGVMIPLPVFDRNQGGVREAAAMARAARANEIRTRAEIAARRETALAERAAAASDFAAHRDRIVPAAERIAAQIASAHSQGGRPATEVVLATRSLAEARMGLVEARRALRLAEAELIELGATVAPGDDR